MPEPSELPDWNNSGSNRVKPDSGHIASGFLAGERPPAKWANWLFGLLGDWVTWLKEVTDEHDERIESNANGLLTAYGSFSIPSGVYASGDYYDLDTEFRSFSPRNQVAASSAGAGQGYRLALLYTAESIGVWDIDIDLEFSTETAATVSGLDLVFFEDSEDTGTVLATFHSDKSADPGGYTSIKGKFRFIVPSAPTNGNHYKFRVNAGSDQQFNISGRRKSIYVTQVSRGTTHGAP